MKGLVVRRRLIVSIVVGLVAALLPLGSQVFGADCPSVAPPPLDFGDPIFIDKSRAGGEPVSVVAQDGSISVSAHSGTTHIYKDPGALTGAGDFLVGYTNQTLNWRSTDGGETWQYVGIPLLREGPHSPTSTGFSDPDYTMDMGGRIYNTEIDLANVAVFSSTDDGQSYPFANPEAASGDRPWLIGGEKDEVYLYVNLPRTFWRSTDGGLTFTPLPSPPISAKGYRDPINPTKGLIGPVGQDGIAISSDKGQTWKQYPGAELGSQTGSFGSLAVDSAGNAYKLSAGGYNGPSDSTADGEVVFNYFDRETMQWGEPVHLDIPTGDAMWPWLAAGDDGRVAVVWMQNLEGKPNELYTFAAYTLNGTGSTVTCSDGTTKFVEPQFSIANASGRPIHFGDVCLGGTGCNASLGDPGDRRLGDFFTVNVDKDGKLFIVSADTTLRNMTGGAKPVGNPIFMKQSAGGSLLEKPMTTRKTRCLTPLPSC
jgi:hypothetical protein